MLEHSDHGPKFGMWISACTSERYQNIRCLAKLVGTEGLNDRTEKYGSMGSARVGHRSVTRSRERSRGHISFAEFLAKLGNAAATYKR